ncbi:hypothetical protein TCAL_00594 [Tigriopus californicus]|uniref:Reelin domain-containing protein n=1 Tax=Tigriopus californicus TaxID=6832 RepID=A0A553PAA2_TIGCA|nr:uncharacterized protein LOC131892808 [Tigriopus californicus]TRY74598.1 hypothetical protein TCAL_00594 [Tigriopus californicus]|eukprot:TCALIF_00594-PA protein Name:"Protein of unknown function" AED:0.00 eAED:0.00 QI:193/1/1/1/1/1/2/59/142
MNRAILFLALVPLGVLGYSTGAPNCEVEQPGHGGNRQTTKLSDFYDFQMLMTTPGKIAVSIVPKDGEHIKGLRITSNTPGVWSLDESSENDFQLLNACGITHIDGKKEKTGQFSFNFDFDAEVGVPDFNVIVVKDFNTWWVL